MAPAFFGFYKFRTAREQIFLLISFIIIHLIFIGQAFQVSWLIRDTFFISAVAVSVKLYFLFLKEYPKLSLFLRSLALVLFYSAINVISGWFVYMINAEVGFLPLDLIIFFARYGALIGLGVGIGMDFYFSIKTNLFQLLKIKLE